MSKKHYERIAEILRDELEFVRDIDGHCPNCEYRIKHIIDEIADYIQEDNSRFDRERFLDACGL